MRVKHGMCGTKLYQVWKGMLQRCNNPNNPKWPRYGMRGIKVCNEWRDFIPFYNWAISNGYKEGLSIDRIDNDGNYCPDNCRWADANMQALNRKQHKSNTGEIGIYKKVYKGKRGETIHFMARVKRNQTMYNVGTFKSLEEAVVARQKFIESMEAI